MTTTAINNRNLEFVEFLGTKDEMIFNDVKNIIKLSNQFFKPTKTAKKIDFIKDSSEEEKEDEEEVKSKRKYTKKTKEELKEKVRDVINIVINAKKDDYKGVVYNVDDVKDDVKEIKEDVKEIKKKVEEDFSEIEEVKEDNIIPPVLQPKRGRKKAT